MQATDALAEIARRIAIWPAELCSFSYQYEMFGCWQIVVRYQGVRTRFSYDGKDGYLSAARLQNDAGDFTKPPKPLGGLDARTGLGTEYLERILDFMRQHAGE